TTNESSANRLIAISDIGANASFTTLATASASNTIFRGLAFAPNTSTCLPPAINTIAQNGPVCSNAALQLSVTVGGTAPFTYTWSGAGQINSVSIANPTVLNATSGAYSVTVSNGCGTATAAVNVSVNAAPTLQVNSATICTGGTATLSASGATSYTWSNGANTSSIVVSPTVNTNYTISGSANGCIGVPINASIIISGSINLTVNSATVCAGSSATLNASGASSYTWNTGANTNAIIVSPSVSTQYTVIATASGCNGTFTANASVFVNSLPTVNLSSATSTICQNGGTVSLNGSPSGGTYTGTGVSGATFNPNTAGAGTHSVSYQITGTNGCKNKASITLTVFAIPQVSLAILNGSSAITTSVLCIQWPSFTLNGLPAGGTYTGNGVSGNAFNPSIAGAGTHSISYSYTDANGCSANATRLLNVSVCGGLKDALNNTITIYPQPASGECYVQASAPIQALDIFNASGQKIYYERGHGNFEQRCTLQLPEGLYWIQVTQTNGIVLRKALIISHLK
ncbi:MAG: T9SS type A sorting domain-containing protein, partial [Bacteroidia bacterium]